MLTQPCHLFLGSCMCACKGRFCNFISVLSTPIILCQLPKIPSITCAELPAGAGPPSWLFPRHRPHGPHLHNIPKFTTNATQIHSVPDHNPNPFSPSNGLEQRHVFQTRYPTRPFQFTRSASDQAIKLIQRLRSCPIFHRADLIVFKKRPLPPFLPRSYKGNPQTLTFRVRI